MNKIIHIILISLFSLTVISCGEKEEKKTEAPVIAEVYAVTTPTSDPSPDYTFSSTKGRNYHLWRFMFIRDNLCD